MRNLLKIFFLSSPLWSFEAFSQSILLRPNRIETDYTNYENVFLRSTATPNIVGVRINGSHANPSATEDGNVLISIEGRGYGGGAFTGVQGALRFTATQNWNANNRGTKAEIFTTPNNAALASSRLFINQNGKVGVGNYLITVPDHQLEIQQASDDDRGVGIYRYGGDAPSYFGISARGTTIIPTATQNGDILARFGGKGFDGTGYTTARARIDMIANQSWTSTATGSKISFYTTENSTIASTAKLTINGNGNVGIGDESPNVKLRVNGDLALDCPEAYIAPTGTGLIERNNRSILFLGDNSGRFIKGITDGKEGIVLHIVWHNDFDANLEIQNESPDVNPAERIITGEPFASPNIQISGRGGCTLIFDQIYQRWRVIGLQK